MLRNLAEAAVAAHLVTSAVCWGVVEEEELEKLELEFAERNEHLYVHLVPHSHNDLGWLKTVDEYFTGSRQDLDEGNVENILDTVIVELTADPSKRYTHAEMKYFQMWWSLQTDQKKT